MPVHDRNRKRPWRPRATSFAWLALVGGLGCAGDKLPGDPNCRLQRSLTFQWVGTNAPDLRIQSLWPPDQYVLTTDAGASCKTALAACGATTGGITPRDVTQVMNDADVEAAWPRTGERRIRRSGGPDKADLLVSELGRGTLVFTSRCTQDCLFESPGLADLEDLIERLWNTMACTPG